VIWLGGVQARSSFSNLAFSSFETWKESEYTFSEFLDGGTYFDPTKVPRTQEFLSLCRIIAFITELEEGSFKIDISPSYVFCASAEG